MSYFETLADQLMADHWAVLKYVLLMVSVSIILVARSVWYVLEVVVSTISNLVTDILIKVVALIFGLMYVFIPGRKK